MTGVKPGVLGQQSDDEALEVWDGPAHAGDAASVAEPRTPIGAGFREPSLLASLTNKRKGAQPYESGNSQIQKLPSLEDSDGDVVTAGGASSGEVGSQLEDSDSELLNDETVLMLRRNRDLKAPVVRGVPPDLPLGFLRPGFCAGDGQDANAEERAGGSSTGSFKRRHGRLSHRFQWIT